MKEASDRSPIPPAIDSPGAFINAAIDYTRAETGAEIYLGFIKELDPAGERVLRGIPDGTSPEKHREDIRPRVEAATLAVTSEFQRMSRIVKETGSELLAGGAYFPAAGASIDTAYRNLAKVAPPEGTTVYETIAETREEIGSVRTILHNLPEKLDGLDALHAESKNTSRGRRDEVTVFEYNGKEFPLSGRQARAIELIMSGGEAVTSEDLATEIWGDSALVGNVRALVLELRRKFGDDGPQIASKRGVGYSVEEADM